MVTHFTDNADFCFLFFFPTMIFYAWMFREGKLSLHSDCLILSNKM